MRTATIYAVVAILASFGLSAFGQQPCPNSGGQPGVGDGGGFPPALETLPPPFEAPLSSTNSQPGSNESTTAPAAPRARIIVAPTTTNPEESKRSGTPSARVSLAVVNPSAINDETAVKSERSPEPESIQRELVALVGNWSAVSRYGDGELATVELKLDNRGWATLTVPDKNGKRSTIERRILLQDQELKLAGPDVETQSLGKLIDFDARQMVLERGDNQVTFVRI